MNNPLLIPQPFANNGNKNTIKNTRETGQSPEDATWADGFPPVTMTPMEAGGLPPKGLDFNGIFYALSDNAVFQAKGGRYHFDATFANSIGGYPKGAILMSADDTKEFISTIANNKNNPNTNMTGWVIYAGAGLILDASTTQKGITQLNDTFTSNSVSQAATANTVKKLNDEKVPYAGATKAVNLNGQQLQNTGDVRLGNGANNSYQAVMFGNYEKTLAGENYGVVHNSRYVPDTLLRFTAISTFSAQGAHISSIFASDKDAILRLGETNYLIALKNEVANKSVKIDSGVGLLGGGDLSVNRTFSIDKASSSNLTSAIADKVVTADILWPFLASRATTATTMTAGTGLTGGGDLSVNRTFSIDKASSSNLTSAIADKVVTADILWPFLASRATTATTMTAGTGLTGGGDLSVNRTFNIDKATATDVSAGGANKVICADVLQQTYANSKLENGYTKLPNGLIFQWGRTPIVQETKPMATYAVTFPISFPNAFLNASISKYDGGGQDIFNILNSPVPAKTGFSFAVSDKSDSPITGGHMMWFAIGF